MKEKQLLLYRNVSEQDILEEMTALYEKMQQKDRSTQKETLYDVCNRLLTLSGNYGFYGNLWHCYLAYVLTGHENVYSIQNEMDGNASGGIETAALHDFKIFKEFFDYDLEALFQYYETPELSFVLDFEGETSKSRVYNVRIRDYICQTSKKLAKVQSEEQFAEVITEFYRKHGVGKFGLHKAFRIVEKQEHEGAEIVPVRDVAHIYLDDLVGYEIAKQKLIENTEAFVEGRKANNCLLFGDAGTGKSSSIKGILNEYYDNGLRIIEIYKHQFKFLPDIISQIKGRNYKFIIYMDDLSFEEFEIEYKYLKAVIEGGLEVKPDNVLIYATSNRRHLIKETFEDKEGRRDALHASDTVQEKLSLVNRFGVTIFFSSPDKKEFQNIVKVLARRYDIHLPEEELLLEANKWELSHGGLSGRTAQQFIDYLLGKKE